MKTKKIALTFLPAALLCLLLAQPAQAYESPEAQSFMTGFNAFRNKDYKSAIKQFSTVLGQQESQLRELALVFLARSFYKEGNSDEASYLLHLWKQEFPDSTLTTTLEQDLVRDIAKSDIKAILARKEQERVAREKAEQERLAAIKAEEERKAREKAESERIAQEKAAAEKRALHKAALYAAVNAPKSVVSYPAGALTAIAAKEITIPLSIANPGILPESFSLSAQFPAGWKSRFVIDGKPVSETATLAPGSATKVTLAFTPPVSILEGQQLSVPLRLTAKNVADWPITSEIPMIASAPIVRAVVKKLDSVDGDISKAQCLVSVLNVGSADAATVSITVSHSASHLPVADGSAPFSRISGDSIRIGTLNLPSGGLQEFLINFKLNTAHPVKSSISCKAVLSLE